MSEKDKEIIKQVVLSIASIREMITALAYKNTYCETLQYEVMSEQVDNLLRITNEHF